MTDKAAKALESLLAATPEGKDYEYRKLITQIHFRDQRRRAFGRELASGRG